MLVLFFADLRTAFDSVDRTKLLNSMRERGVREGLVERCGDVLRKTSFRGGVLKGGGRTREGVLDREGGKARVPIKPGFI